MQEPARRYKEQGRSKAQEPRPKEFRQRSKTPAAREARARIQ